MKEFTQIAARYGSIREICLSRVKLRWTKQLEYSINRMRN